MEGGREGESWRERLRDKYVMTVCNYCTLITQALWPTLLVLGRRSGSSCLDNPFIFVAFGSSFRPSPPSPNNSRSLPLSISSSSSPSPSPSSPLPPTIPSCTLWYPTGGDGTGRNDRDTREEKHSHTHTQAAVRFCIPHCILCA